MLLSQKRKICCEFFFAFSKVRFNFEYIQKKRMTIITDAFLKLWTPEDVGR